jgi:hypothetical protein
MCGTGFSFAVYLSSGVFEISEASGVRTGTKIIIHLKSDCREFASEARVRGEWGLDPPWASQARFTRLAWARDVGTVGKGWASCLAPECVEMECLLTLH